VLLLAMRISLATFKLAYSISNVVIGESLSRY
jgi:hypothetical protein